MKYCKYVDLGTGTVCVGIEILRTVCSVTMRIKETLSMTMAAFLIHPATEDEYSEYTAACS